MNKNKTFKPDYKADVDFDHPDYENYKKETNRFLDQKVNHIHFKLLVKANEDGILDIIQPSTFGILTENENELPGAFPDFHREWLLEFEKNPDEHETFLQWIADHEEYPEIEEYIECAFDNSEHYPSMNIVYVSKEKWFGDWLAAHVDDLFYLNIGVFEADPDGLHEAGFFVKGGGYDFTPTLIKLFQLVLKGRG